MTISNEAAEAAAQRQKQTSLEWPSDAMHAALQAAAPYLYPASGEVGEAVERVRAAAAGRRAGVEKGARRARSSDLAKEIADQAECATVGSLALLDVEALLSALSEATERAGRMERERNEAWERAERLQREINEALMLTEAASSLKGLAAGFIEGAHAQAEATRLKEKLDEAEAKVKELEAPFDWTSEDLADLMAEAIMDAIDMDTNATDYARAALRALNKEGLLRSNDNPGPDQ